VSSSVFKLKLSLRTSGRGCNISAPGLPTSGGEVASYQRSTALDRALAKSQKCVKPTHAIAVGGKAPSRTLASTPFIRILPPLMSAPSARIVQSPVGSFSSCPVFGAHDLSASGFVLAAPVWKRRTPRRGFEVRLRQLPYRPVLLLCRPLCWWSVSLFDLRAVSSSRPALAQ